jgi:hypothetical protein
MTQPTFLAPVPDSSYMSGPICLLAVALALQIIGVSSAFGQDAASPPKASSAQLLAFARSNADKFSTELVPSAGLPLGVPIRARVELSSLNF